MRLFTKIAIYFYVLTISIGCGVVILFVTHTFMLDDVKYYMDLIYSQPRLGTIVGVTSGMLMVISLMFERIMSEARQKERTIAFDNPSGRVTISLVAMEDFIKRLVYKISEVREVRAANIVKTKKGIEVEMRLTLKADVNIPEATTRLQELAKSKVQDMLGVDEAVIVRVHISKIVSEEVKHKRGRSDFDDKIEPAVPFHGYRDI
ncbi:MAG: alkaline shock response membrane anchor protein AmaP [Candidatus Omnitrophota bacterium]